MDFACAIVAPAAGAVRSFAGMAASKDGPVDGPGEDPARPPDSTGHEETWLAPAGPPRASTSKPSITETHVAEPEEPAARDLAAERTQPVHRAAPSMSHEAPTEPRLPPRTSTHDTRPEGAGASWESAHLPPLPERIGRFEIKGRLGAGGMGMVFEGRDTTLDRRIAVKLLRLDDTGSQSDEASARLLREAQALARLSHPNVIQVYEVGTWREQVFVAMEFIDGQTFEDWQRDPDLPWQEVLRAYVDAGRGLMAAHDAGIVHRDFKPSNVMRARDGRVVVLDFGLARHTHEGAESELDDPDDDFESRVTRRRASASASMWRRTLDDAIGTPLTATGAVMGTPAYMAPEQHEGLHTDARTDQFAFCVALYEALYGERPFEGGSLAMLASAVIEGRVRPAPEYTRVPNWAREVLLRGLAVDPAKRYDSMHELLEALDQVPERGRRLRLALAAAGAVGLGLAAWAYFKGPSLEVGPARQRLRTNLAIADARGHELDAEGHGTPASQHWDALVLAHARESMSRDPTESIASLQHLTPGDPFWVPSARLIAAEARDRGAAWRTADFAEHGGIEQVEVTTLGDVALLRDANGGLHRWILDADTHGTATFGGRAPKSTTFALGGTGRTALVAMRDGRLWELSLTDMRASPTDIELGCDDVELRVDRDALRAAMLCDGRWRRLRKTGRGWVDVGAPSVDGRLLDVALHSDGAALLVARGSKREVLFVPHAPQAGAEAGTEAGEPEAHDEEIRPIGSGSIEGAEAFVTHAGATDDNWYVRTRDAVVDASTGSEVRALRRGVPVQRGAAGLVWVDDEELVVERGLEGRRLVGHGASVRHLAAAPAQAHVLSVDEEGHARVWRPRRGGGRLLTTGGGGVEVLDFDRDGRILFTGSRDGRVRRRDFKTGDVRSAFKYPGVVKRMRTSPDGQKVAVAGEVAGVRVWSDRDEGPKIFAKDQQPARSLAWAHGSDRVAAGTCTGGAACGVHVFELASGESRTLEGAGRAPAQIVFSADDEMLAALEANEAGAKIWLADLGAGGSRELRRVKQSFGRVENLAFDVDGRLWVAWHEVEHPDALQLWQVDAQGRAAEVTRLGGVQARFSDATWVGWARAGSVTLLELTEGRVHQIFDVRGPIRDITVRRGGSGVALFDAAEAEGEGALLVDFASHERRRVNFGEGAHAWGLAIVDAPGSYLRAYDDSAPQSPEELARWILAESNVWVEPASMHRSTHAPPSAEPSLGASTP